jgi:hypothetical protein
MASIMDLKTFGSTIEPPSEASLAEEGERSQTVGAPLEHIVDTEELVVERDNSPHEHGSIAVKDTITLRDRESDDSHKWTFPWALAKTWKVK